jgi:hypothetical protein
MTINSLENNVNRVQLILAVALSLLLGTSHDSARAAEPLVGKLVIVKAVYGDLPDGQKSDVTEKVAGMVKDDRLSVEASNDNFGDPADGVVKKLKVDYTVGGVARSKTVNEAETLKISGKKSKLVIKKAFYGDLPDGQKTDVTDKVADQIADDALSVEANNANFGDPADGVVKKLKVDYAFDGKEKSKTVDENETLTINDKGD